MAGTGPDQLSRAGVAQAAAGLSFAAALIHGSVIASHFREYWLFGAFFVVAALAQLAWAGLVAAGRRDGALLAAGAVGNLAIAVIWLASRTVGLPIGPEAGEREGIGVHDVLATADELALVGAVLWILMACRGSPAWLLAAAWTLAAAGGVSAFLGPH